MRSSFLCGDVKINKPFLAPVNNRTKIIFEIRSQFDFIVSNGFTVIKTRLYGCIITKDVESRTNATGKDGDEDKEQSGPLNKSLRDTCINV